MRIGHHAAKLLLGGEAVGHLCQYAVEDGVVAKLLHHRLHGSVDARAVSDANQMSLLVDDLTVLQLQFDLGHVGQLLACLRNEHAAVNVIAFECRVRVTADNEIRLGEDFG